MNWNYVVGIVGALGAFVWSVFTWHRAQTAMRNQSEYGRKEGLYRELLRTMSVFYKGAPKSDTGPFLEQYRLAWLYAPDTVIRVLNVLVTTLKVDSSEQQMPPDQLHELQDVRDKQAAQALSNLVTAIRKDLLDTVEKRTELEAADFGHYS